MPADADAATLGTDRLLTLAQVAPIFSQRERKTIDAPRIVRYITRGYRGVKLLAVQRGDEWLTTVAAVQRFFAALDRQP